jgi:6-phosphogluconate dehydrogenase
MSVTQLHKVFAGWAKGELASYLIDVTVAVLGRQDERTGQPLVDCIVDAAEQKGTGRWTSQEAFELGVPIPSISAAVEARSLSALREVRAQASRSLVGADALGEGGGDLTEAAGAALYAGVVSAYAQGMELLRAGSLAHQYNLDLSEVARIWRAGCIIRASLLEDIRSAFVGSPAVSNLLLAEPFRTSLIRRQMPWRWVVQWAIGSGVPVPALGSALAYYDSLRSERLPANLIQAQRDYFGAHTYRRLDQEGIFHTDWGD